ncbi:rRNA maturation RNase YbeY [Sulfitobacter aestuarii]|uniref:Endoribonuclease YbeY n=1 Tax=Sulfitobacter aestuarii TaxID=2161676 RepID=A0ABW5U4N2_9RHOB
MSQSPPSVLPRDEAVTALEALELVIADDRWAALALEPLVQRAATAVLARFGLDPALAEVSILACDDAHIARLNGEFRDKPRPTNVLSWPAEERGAEQPGDTPAQIEPGFDGMIELGDIALAYETCAAEAEAASKPFADHVTHLTVHGLLHLLGYDHQNEADARLMEGLEVEILGNLGLDDPYRDIEAGPTRCND